MNAYMSGHNFKGNVLEYYGNKLGKTGKFLATKAGKLNKAAGKISPWLTAGTVGIDVTAAYFNKNNSKTYHNAGHSAVHAGLKMIRSIGPADGAAEGALMGARFGVPGAVAGSIGGFAFGAFNRYGGKITDNAYKTAEKIGDKVVDTAGKIWKNITGRRKLI